MQRSRSHRAECSTGRGPWNLDSSFGATLVKLIFRFHASQRTQLPLVSLPVWTLRAVMFRRPFLSSHVHGITVQLSNDRTTSPTHPRPLESQCRHVVTCTLTVKQNARTDVRWSRTGDMHGTLSRQASRAIPIWARPSWLRPREGLGVRLSKTQRVKWQRQPKERLGQVPVFCLLVTTPPCLRMRMLDPDQDECSRQPG
ncbi:hypothetical protein BCR34DRAFT_134561 [Clohesyomyces aquaticus]|uniref:Uncharacterized protein n=1 Tax=Clohesyomyces aquaticus TaxID=1231657 RepID=A0A1Y2AC23_9PLEO|nr:hypothetical protein BCR34DRAFT_134561 [Clohesyomyces aquaticus]